MHAVQKQVFPFCGQSFNGLNYFLLLYIGECKSHDYFSYIPGMGLNVEECIGIGGNGRDSHQMAGNGQKMM